MSNESYAVSELVKTLAWADYDPVQHLDFRAEAMAVCGMWATARDAVLSRRTGRLGLVRRAHLVQAARALEALVGPTKAEHPDAHVARLACVDWIAHTVGKTTSLLSRKNAKFLDRFMWGYVERTAAFSQFFEARKAGATLNVPRPTTSAPTRQCYVGCAYGAPTLAAVLRGTGGVRGRGRHPYLFIDDEAYAILGKNKAAVRLLHLQDGLHRDLDGCIPAEAAQEVLSLAPLDEPTQWPAFVVQRADGPRLVLHLAFGRRGAGRRDLADDPNWWRRLKGISLMEALTEAYRRDFRPTTEDGTWGDFEQLLWHLSEPTASARTHRALFSRLPTIWP